MQIKITFSVLMLCSIQAFGSFGAKPESLVITIGGDVNFSQSQADPHPMGIEKYGSFLTYEKQSKGIRSLLKGADVNFCNIETVVTERADLLPVEKQYVFRSHPNALEHLIQIGFNMFSLANNHSQDYGHEGIAETLHYARQFESLNNVAFSGLGEDLEDATNPKILEVNGVRIAFIALGNSALTYGPQSNQPGVLVYKSETHFNKALKKLRKAPADLRFVSIHTGTERQLELDEGQRARFQRIVKEGNADLVIGHHPHIVRPIEIMNGKVLFYSLGNYMMVGSGNITKSGPAADYGLFAKIYFKQNPQGKYEISAVQAIPLTDTHSVPRQMNTTKSEERIRLLNDLSFQELGLDAMEFSIEPKTGTGLWLPEKGN